jgi:3',5'-cyclic AMP phosphodiesterase CpdA
MFVLAHLSDPHLAPLPQPRLIALAGKRVTGYLNWRRKRARLHRPEVLAAIVADLRAQAADHIALTGDLINISLPEEYVQARAFLAALGSPRDVTLVPGNHDVYVRAAIGLPAAHWGDYMRGDEDDAHQAAFPSLRRRGPLALIGLSSAVPTAPFMATGYVGNDQLARLAQLLERCAQDGLCRVVLVHHPPLSNHERSKRLIDAPALRDVLARYGAELVLHGHDHARALVVLESARQRVPMLGVPSASEAPPGEHDPAAYNLYRIARADGGWRIDMTTRGIARGGGAVVELARATLAG